MSGTELGDVAYIMPPYSAKLANRGRATDLPWRLVPSIASNSLLGSQLIEMQLLLEEKSVGLVGQQPHICSQGQPRRIFYSVAPNSSLPLIGSLPSSPVPDVAVGSRRDGNLET
jgi:hypothetical protein